MPQVTLVSDLTPESNWAAFEQLKSLSHLLTQSGHELSLWLSPSAREQEDWPKKAQKLSPCPSWSSFDALRALPFWMSQKTDILHFVPDTSSKNSTHAFAWMVPFFKSFHSPLIVSSFYSWPQRPSFHLRQLLHLSDLVLTPSEYLKHLISAAPDSTAAQAFHRLPLLASLQPAESEQVSGHLKELAPFIYLPGDWDEWEVPLDALEAVLVEVKNWEGWVVAGNNWTSNYKNSKALQKLTLGHKVKVFFPERLNLTSHQWLAQHCLASWLKGLKLHSLTLSLAFEDAVRFNRPPFFSKLQAELHSPNWASLTDLIDSTALGSALRQPVWLETMARRIQELKASALSPDPASQLNRLYSLALSR